MVPHTMRKIRVGSWTCQLLQVTLFLPGSRDRVEKVKVSIAAASDPRMTLDLELPQGKRIRFLCQSKSRLLLKRGCHPEAPITQGSWQAVEWFGFLP